MAMFDKLLANLRASEKTIVFTEGTDERILSAADRLLKEDLMGVILCGNVDEVKAAAKNGGFNIDGVDMSDGTVLFTAPKHFNFADPNLRYEINGDEITIYADAFAKYVEIYSPYSDFILSDNYFDMNAGSKSVKILEGTPKTIALRSVYDIK